MALCSPFLRTLPLEQHGLKWIFPSLTLAHPLDDGSAGVLYGSVNETARGLGVDGEAYRTLVGEFLPAWENLFTSILAPWHPVKHPFLMAKFGLRALRSARTLARQFFRTEKARALFAGIAGHAMLPLETLTSAAPALALAIAAHARGWPFAEGGAQQLTNAMVSYLRYLGGELVTGYRLESLDDLPETRAVLLDVTPRQLLKIAGNRLPENYQNKLRRYRYGMGVFKLDWALKEPVPWRSPECREAGTLHLGASLEEISDSERAAWRGKVAKKPFVLFAQPTIVDRTRAPEGKHIAWAYCHVPNGFTGSMAEAIEGQVERFAPGFRDCITARSIIGPKELEQHNSNLIGGDIGGGAPVPGQLFLRPTASLYVTPIKGVYLCSASTPPGPGVHGMCGYFAAEAALRC
jgi:phytoene dehydrogenase-like protein